ncbi:hypothetical protein ED733_008545 [Metarhizium rileyi]|uniref:Protection of telomeres protein 1 n=1 Tax=Metarhizium rileyi (strain RCEF 4871) TaxID=1649241 RepID=A0A5C6GN95_METRR|nr:hypothetical protein ED733_008545 [Metarhizium rileyi]
MATTRSLARQGRPPAGFTSIRDVLDGKINAGSRINLIGVLTDFRAPIPTKGKDWKCQMRIYDQSVEDDPNESILLNVFWPQDDMPDARCGDVIVTFSAKVQHYEASISLCTHATTDLHIYESSKIPKPRADASRARRPSNKTKINRHPNKYENEFVSILYSTINKERIPTESEFNVLKENSTRVKNKYSELKDLRDGLFVDTVVQIVKEPYDLGDKFTLWVSDYTEHASFYQYKFMAGSSRGQDDNPSGYLSKSPDSSQKSSWTGPFGQRSMQVTCFEPHASIIREQHLSLGTWVSLRNLQIKFGHSVHNLEGYLREDRGAQTIKINISKLDHLDTGLLAPELRNALEREEKYKTKVREDLKQIVEAASAGLKRKAQLGEGSESHSKPLENSKAKRNKNRLAKQQEYNRRNGLVGDVLPPQTDTTGNVPTDLNVLIKCENKSKPPTSVADILAPTHYETTTEGGDTITLELPFINANYRTYVRVTDFRPSRLEDFARLKKRVSEYAALSDNEDSDSASASDSDNVLHLLSRDARIVTEWEWRFYLKLEDASCENNHKESIWVVVNNQSAQMLLSLDASDLKRDDENLDNLRQKLWLLWGDLEEYQAKVENRAFNTRQPNNGDVPPGHSDDEDEPQRKRPAQEQLSNLPFGCCICQYGATVSEKDETKADAGNGRRWERMFGLFGTRISG